MPTLRNILNGLTQEVEGPIVQNMLAGGAWVMHEVTAVVAEVEAVVDLGAEEADPEAAPVTEAIHEPESAAVAPVSVDTAQAPAEPTPEVTA